MRMLSLCLLGTMLLGACGQDTPPKQEQPMPVEQTFAGDLIKQKERITDQAQQQMENRMPDLNRQLDAAEGNKPPAEPQD